MSFTDTNISLNKEQAEAMDKLHEWYDDSTVDKPFVLTGSAGTGKTWLVSQFVNSLNLSSSAVIGCALSGAATNNLAEKMNYNLTPKTIASIIRVPVHAAEISLRGKVIFKSKSIDDLIDYITIQRNNDLMEHRNELLTMLQKSKKLFLSAQKHDASVDSLNYIPYSSINKELDSTVYIIKLGVSFMPRLAEDIGDGMNDIKLLVVDEIGMVGDDDTRTLIDIAKAQNIKMLVLGDYRQLHPIQQQQINMLLTENYRNDSEWTADLIQNMRQAGQAALGFYAKQVFDTKFPKYATKSNLMDVWIGIYYHYHNQDLSQLFDAVPAPKILDDSWYNTPQKFSEQWGDVASNIDICLCWTNKQVAMMNACLRSGFLYNSKQAQDTPLVVNERLRIEDRGKVPGMYFQKSDLITIDKIYSFDELRRNLNFGVAKAFDDAYLKLVDLTNGKKKYQYIIVNTYGLNGLRQTKYGVNWPTRTNLYSLESNLNRLQSHAIEQLKAVVLNAEHHNKMIAGLSANEENHKLAILYPVYGYAMTVHKAQGKEWDNVGWYQTDQRLTMIDRSLLYTAITRAKKHFVMLGDSTSYYVDLQGLPQGFWRDVHTAYGF